MKQFRLVIVILLLVPSLFAQSAVEKNLRTHVQLLASDKLEGRRTGDAGAKQAADYIAAEFAKYKLRTGRPTGTSYFQDFPYIAGVALGSGNALQMVPSDATREQKMEVGINWMPLGYSPNADIPLSEIVFVNYGVVAPEAKYDDYVGVDARNKIVLMYDSTPDAGNPHSAFSGFNIHTKANIAKDKGAKAIILIAAEDDFKSDRLSRLAYDRTLGETALPVVGIMRNHAADLIAASGSDEKAKEEMEKAAAATSTTQADESFSAAPAAPSSAAAVAAMANKPAPPRARIRIDLAKKTVDAVNVIGIVPGNDPVLKNEAIIVGAHYDHLGHGGSGSLVANSTEIHHGADDNASGTSAVLELARQFAAEKNKRTMIFIAFAGEEEGLLGSKYYVEHPLWPLDKTIAMINLDMVGRLNENKLTVGGIGTASEWKGIVNEFALRQSIEPSDFELQKRIRESLRAKGFDNIFVEVDGGVPTLKGWAPPARYAEAIRTVADSGISHFNNQVMKVAQGWDYFDFNLQLNEDGFGPSDHSSFYSKKIPVLFLFTGTHTDYHKPSDTFDKINYEGLTRVTNYVGQIVRSIDANAAKPTYAVAKSSGQMGQVRLSVSLGTIPSYADSTDGMALDGVRDGSPAAKAGLKAGDKILKLAGKDVRNAMDYTYVLGSMKPGDEYEVEIMRGTERMKLKIVPAPAARRP